MFAKKTVLVVGAGASNECGMPTGFELAKYISAMLKLQSSRDAFSGSRYHDEAFIQAALRMFGNSNALNHHLELSQKISEGVRLVGSIDNYIDKHRHEPRVAALGKAAIAYSILKKEASTALYPGSGKINFENLETTWYPRFGRILADRISNAEVDAIFNNLTIICFNYDRCIEQFLVHWLDAVYSLALGRAAEIVRKLKIIRPYGHVAPWIGPNAVAFGHDPSRVDLKTLVSNIKTFTEQIEDELILGEISHAITEAQTIVFLGFAYAPQNLQLLRPSEKMKARRVYGTASGISDPNRAAVERNIKKVFTTVPDNANPVYIIRNDLRCAGFFDEFDRTLSA